MRIIRILLLVILLIADNKLLAQDLVCATLNTEQSSAQTGGRYITSQGTLKVLVVFARFKDDTDPHNYWPVDDDPDGWNTYIDPNTTTGSTHLINITNYFNTMSGGTFHVIGESVSVETPQDKSYYISQGQSLPNRYLATKEVLQQKVDPLVNFSNYDNWTYDSNFTHTNQPDGTVDMIVMIWRGLQFNSGWGGEASFGGGSSYIVEGSKTIKSGFGGGNGSGVTVHSWGARDQKYNFHSAIHEIAHWLLGGNHPYAGSPVHGFWGMLTTSNLGLCANTYEREKLAWINPSEIDEDILNAPMGDYLTSSTAYKYHPANGGTNEFYYFENHQQLNIYDDATLNPNDKGIFIVHQNGNYNSESHIMRVKTSNGQWSWENPSTATCFGVPNLPSFKTTTVNRAGKNNRDKLTDASSNLDWLFSYIDNNGNAECGGYNNGVNMNNSFNLTYNNVFSPYSNPYSHTWGNTQEDFTMEVYAQNGSTLNAKFFLDDPLEGKPSKPQKLQISVNGSNAPVLTWEPNLEGDLNQYKIYRASVHGSGEPSTFSYVTTINAFNNGKIVKIWTDPFIYVGTGTDRLFYKISAVDNSSLESVLTDYSWIYFNYLAQKINSANPTIVKEYFLSENYPNPFNPTTQISYSLKEDGFVTLKIYDVLGNEVATLVNEPKAQGNYSINFDASQLTSGVYVYTIKVNDFAASKKMILTK